MRNRLMMGWWRYMVPVPPFLSEKQMAKNKAKIVKNLAFMTEDHRRVHHFAVREMPRAGKPLTPPFIAGALNMPLERVNAILADLEAHLTFLFRNDAGEVLWAYPVTAAETPHQVTFDTGETIYAA